MVFPIDFLKKPPSIESPRKLGGAQVGSPPWHVLLAVSLVVRRSSMGI
jgi:hypothetical protein